MNYDQIIDCPKSGGDLCYKTEINDKITNYLSLSCGFWTNSLMKKDSEFHKEQLVTLPELYKDISWEDPETGLIWIPNTINIKEKGMVFADGPNGENWRWAAVKATLMDKEESEKFKAKGKDFKWKMNMKTIKHFEETDFIEAMDYIGVFEKS
tara:strand:+ start:19072 stop:19530 length:459 start_codon:yes stop_codon:yes gene_type:complete